MTTLRLNYSQLSALDPLRRQAGNNGVVACELVDGKLHCHVVSPPLVAAIRAVVREHVRPRDFSAAQNTYGENAICDCKPFSQGIAKLGFINAPPAIGDDWPRWLAPTFWTLQIGFIAQRSKTPAAGFTVPARWRNFPT